LSMDRASARPLEPFVIEGSLIPFNCMGLQAYMCTCLYVQKVSGSAEVIHKYLRSLLRIRNLFERIAPHCQNCYEGSSFGFETMKHNDGVVVRVHLYVSAAFRANAVATMGLIVKRMLNLSIFVEESRNKRNGMPYAQYFSWGAEVVLPREVTHLSPRPQNIPRSFKFVPLDENSPWNIDLSKIEPFEFPEEVSEPDNPTMT